VRPLCTHRGRNWSEATQTLKKLYKLLETLRMFYMSKYFFKNGGKMT
jgi:transposase-like protein